MATSVSRKIRFTHVPKDGMTPIFDRVTNGWKYRDTPTTAEMQYSAGRLSDLEAVSAEAATKATDASTLATTAKQVADTKATPAQAVQAVKDDMFEVVPLTPSGVSTNNVELRTISFEEVSQGKWTVWINTGAPGAPTTSANRGWLDYADWDSFNEFADRVIALEEKVAALERKVGK